MFEETELTTILRVVPALQKEFDTHIKNKDPVQIEILPSDNYKEEGRLCSLSMGSAMYRGILLDLPSHVEAYKTLDTQQYYKTNDIGQIILIVERESELRAFENTTYLPDGLTPPMTGAYDRLQRSISSMTDCRREDVSAIEKFIMNNDTKNKGMEFTYDQVFEQEGHMKDYSRTTKVNRGGVSV